MKIQIINIIAINNLWKWLAILRINQINSFHNIDKQKILINRISLIAKRTVYKVLKNLNNLWIKLLISIQTLKIRMIKNSNL